MPINRTYCVTRSGSYDADVFSSLWLVNVSPAIVCAIAEMMLFASTQTQEMRRQDDRSAAHSMLTIEVLSPDDTQSILHVYQLRYRCGIDSAKAYMANASIHVNALNLFPTIVNEHDLLWSYVLSGGVYVFQDAMK